MSNGIRFALENRALLSQESAELSREKRQRWDHTHQELVDRIGETACTAVQLGV